MTINENLITTGTSAAILRAIDRLKVSDKWRARLRDVARLAIKVGPLVHRIGVTLIRAVVRASREYPSTATVVVVGAVLTVAASMIPLLGAVLGPIVAGISMMTATISFCLEFMRKEVASFTRPQPSLLL